MLRDKLYDISERMHLLVKRQIGVCVLPTEDFGWENYRYYSPSFRLMHIERYFEDGLLVLHVTCFPHANSAAPIFGFDIIGSEKSDKVTGLFLDWSPVLYDQRWNLSKEWKNNRELPEWANIFSSQMIAIRPDSEEELDKILEYAYTCMCDYMIHNESLMNSSLCVDTTIKLAIEKQNTYCEQQAKNPRTLAALTHKIGEDRANYFMQNILFPKIDNFASMVK